MAEENLPTRKDQLSARVRSYFLRSRGTLIARKPPKALHWNAAAASYDDAVMAMPRNAAALYFAGMSRFSQGSYAKAASFFAQSLSADCDFAPAYSHLATCCLLLGNRGACVEVSEAMLLRHGRM